MDLKEVYKKIAEAKVGKQRDEDLRDGSYVLAFRGLEQVTTQDGGIMLVFKHQVILSEPVFTDVIPNAVGTQVPYKVAFFGNGARSAGGNAKTYVAALFGLDADTLSAEQVFQYLDKMREDASLVGRLIECGTYRKQVKSRPNDKDAAGRFPFVATRWTHVSTDKYDQNEIKKQLK